MDASDVLLTPVEVLARDLGVALPRLILDPKLGSLLVERLQEGIRSQSVLAAHFHFGLSAELAVDVVDLLLRLNYMHILEVHFPQSDIVCALW